MAEDFNPNFREQTLTLSTGLVSMPDLSFFNCQTKICIQTRAEHRMIVWDLFYATGKFFSLL